MLESTSPAYNIQLTAVCVSAGLINAGVSHGTRPQNWNRRMLCDPESLWASLFVFLFSLMKPGTGLHSQSALRAEQSGGVGEDGWRQLKRWRNTSSNAAPERQRTAVREHAVELWVKRPVRWMRLLCAITSRSGGIKNRQQGLLVKRKWHSVFPRPSPFAPFVSFLLAAQFIFWHAD